MRNTPTPEEKENHDSNTRSERKSSIDPFKKGY